jgi:threonine dehydrogenase-like Zn-dependent dehydrogenase
MPSGVYVDDKGSFLIREYEDHALKPDEVRIQTELATIKHGTFFSLYSGVSPFQEKSFDVDKRLFVENTAGKQPAPVHNQFIGNMVAGRVIEVGDQVKGLELGAMVFGYGAICETITQKAAAVHLIKSPLTAANALCFDPARMAYTAIRDARICLGDDVAIFGLGAIGLLIVQMLKQSGCLNIIACDPIEKRRNLAQSYGASLVLDPSACDVAVEIRRTLGKGADISMEASGKYKALQDAVRSVRNCARVLTLGYYMGNGSDLRLGEEWLHNRLELIFSMPDWSNPMREYPLWDNERVTQTVENFFTRSFITSDGILDPIVNLKDAANEIKNIWENPSGSIKLGVRFQ